MLHHWSPVSKLTVTWVWLIVSPIKNNFKTDAELFSLQKSHRIFNSFCWLDSLGLSLWKAKSLIKRCSIENGSTWRSDRLFDSCRSWSSQMIKGVDKRCRLLHKSWFFIEEQMIGMKIRDFCVSGRDNATKRDWPGEGREWNWWDAAANRKCGENGATVKKTATLKIEEKSYDGSRESWGQHRHQHGYVLWQCACADLPSSPLKGA